MRICSNCFGVIYLNDWECGCGRQNKGMGVDQQLLKPLDVEQKLKADGWRRCAEGQGETQFCAMLEAAVLAEREACAQIAEDEWMKYTALEEMHHRLSSLPFNPNNFDIDMSIALKSKHIADLIRDRGSK